ncbi:penicillin-binding protein 2 [Ammoniphilus sp. CFH 90114]|uniref:peptidoglycan D,D-transpeptidase FtsI family protein n=1 Tax=Ammoniphilus sp. CFH 90114 TaxID=2493665 RepID=UPI00100DE67D|nr:penicillin-binding transpeptidase domain-containing protein [Ammoniphilus sp. CFH 90114]RXT08142.1 penicillin-binding protein [Ammoniphilus sp. CFH 90114]
MIYNYNNEEKKKQQQTLISRRIQLLFTIVFIFFAALIFRLSIVQIAKGEEYLKIATEKSIQTIPIAAPRGKILDKNGEILVDNKVSYTAVFREEDWMTKDYILYLANQVSPVLQLPVDEVLKKMDTGYNAEGERVIRKDPKFLEKDLKFDLKDYEISILSEQRTVLKGIDVVVKPVRFYREGENRIAVQTIGFVRPYAVAETARATENYYKQRKETYLPNQYVGMDGVEFSYEDILAGQNGAKKLLVNARGTLLEEVSVTKPTPGNNLYLTFDERVQKEAQQFVANYIKELRQRPNAHTDTRQVKNAYAVAIETETGKIAAIVSHPDYDPNVWIRGVDQEVYNDIQFSINNGTIRSAPYDARPKPLKESERHPSSMVPMGSTVKPLTVLMGLNEKIISPYDRWRDPVVYRYGRGTDSITNANRRDLGWLTPQISLQKSSNTYMARIAENLVSKGNSVQTFQRYHHHFGMGIQTGVKLPFESKGLEDYVDTSKRISALAGLVQASFGQQERYTTMQMAQYTATLANKGKRLRPQIVDRIESKDEIKVVEPEVLSEIEIPDLYWKVVIDGMKMVTRPGGTAVVPFQGFPYSVASKTGTSEQDMYVEYEDGKWKKDRRVENATFIAFAPAEKPKLAIAVVVPEGGRGTNSASYIARGLFDIYDKYIGLGDQPRMPPGPVEIEPTTPAQ